MKKLMILTAVTMLLTSSVGCECGGLFRRGAFFRRAQPEVVCVDPCAPCVSPCDAGGCADGCAPAITTTPIVPGPETYAPVN